MRRCNHFYNVPESKEDCDETVCQECEHMRELELYGVIMCGKCLHEMAEARREEEEKAALEMQEA